MLIVKPTSASHIWQVTLNLDPNSKSHIFGSKSVNSCPNSASSVRELIAEAEFGTLAVSEVKVFQPNSKFDVSLEASGMH